MYEGDDRIDRDSIDAPLVRRLIADQFPEWAGLPVSRVDQDGWDNRTFRLGDRMKVRMPTGAWYALQIEKEHRWLPMLAPVLPVRVPRPLAMGAPGAAYPWPWSVYEWLDGETADRAWIASLPRFAGAVARFVAALRMADAAGGPPPGKHNFFRGGPVSVYGDETRTALDALAGRIDTEAAAGVWDAALRAEWRGPPVWFHGDVASGNLLVEGGSLFAVIDFGTSGVGDPACDLVIAWTMFEGESRTAFRAALPADDAEWARARGWALWKALITLARHIDSDPVEAVKARRVLEEVVADHVGANLGRWP